MPGEHILRGLRLHLALLVIAVLSASVGAVLLPGATGAVLGAIAALITDPLLFSLAILLGIAFSSRTVVLVAALVISAVVFSMWISIINADLGAKLNHYSLLMRIASFLLIGLSADAFTRLVVGSHLFARRKASNIDH